MNCSSVFGKPEFIFLTVKLLEIARVEKQCKLCKNANCWRFKADVLLCNSLFPVQ